MKYTSIATLLTCLLMTNFTSAEIHADPTPKHTRPQYKWVEGVIHDVPTEEKLIALSFDDGPNPIYTPKVLDLLKKYNAKATFFVIGSRVQKYHELVQRENAEGHEIANHTYSHRKRLTDHELKEDIAKAQAEISNVIGHEPRLFRPPGGYYDSHLVSIAKQTGCQVVLWSNDPRDWSRPGANKIVQNVMNHVYKGVIILLHDHGPDRSQTIEALGQLLPHLEQQGYRFVTISELIKKQGNRQPAHTPKSDTTPNN